MIVQIIIAIVASGGFWTLLQTALTNRQKRKSAEGKLLLGIAFDRICERAERHLDEGFITTEDYNDLNKYMYQPYKQMGGNGTCERLMEQVRELPNRREE